MFLRRGKTDIFQDIVALRIQQFGLRDISVVFAVVKQDEILVRITRRFVLQQSQPPQITALLINNGLDRIGGHGNRHGGSQCRFRLGGNRLLLLHGMLRLRRLRCREKLLPTEQYRKRDNGKGYKSFRIHKNFPNLQNVNIKRWDGYFRRHYIETDEK